MNDVSFAGPSLKESLEDVLLRFRCYNHAFSADIEKAFLQIGITPEHRDYIRFLWFKDIKNIDFEHFENCLLYTSPSPRDATLSRMPSSA